MTDKSILKKYVCLNPFRYLDIQENSQWVCCPSWCPADIRETEKPFSKMTLDENLKATWFSDKASQIRQSVTDGSYKFCDHKVCPSLSQLLGTGKPSGNFVSKEDFDKQYDLYNFKELPKDLLFGFDRSCNLKCPSCRVDLVTNDEPESHDHKIKQYVMDSIEQEYSSSIQSIMITGSGDPIYSKLYRTFLQNFDASKYPDIKDIKLITNGNLLDEKMWNTFKAAPYITKIEVSVDAANKHTYENLVRLNGNWDRLIENLHFLSTLDTIKEFTCSMVVSVLNYHEMQQFHNLITNIFKNTRTKLTILYTQHVYWHTGAYLLNDMVKLSVFDPHHPKHEQFLEQLNMIKDLKFVRHNFHHLLK